jgi:hypothetical protein
MDWQQLLNPAILWILIPLTYIVFSGIQTLCQMYYEHVERIAMIQQGMVPPARPAETEDACA